MNMLKNETKKRPVRYLRNSVNRLLFGQAPRKRRPWQAKRQNSREKVALIAPVLEHFECRSVLDVGCNAGEVSRLIGQSCFVVGVDQRLNVNGFADPLRLACLGEIQVNLENVSRIPTFDAALLLSVHHQWHYHEGEDFAREMVRAVASKAARVFIIEFAALNTKYQASGPGRFRDNDEQSVTTYAKSWLAEVLPSHPVTYLGKTIESPHEPYRFMFSCAPNRPV